jgi:hypothetical protein
LFLQVTHCFALEGPNTKMNPMFPLKMLLSLLVSNWLYTEICYFIPGFDAFARRTINSMAIPRHDQWIDIARSAEGSKLAHSIDSSLRSSGFTASPLWRALTDPRAAATWHLGEVPRWNSFDTSGFTSSDSWSFSSLIGTDFWGGGGSPLESSNLESFKYPFKNGPGEISGFRPYHDGFTSVSSVEDIADILKHGFGN